MVKVLHPGFFSTIQDLGRKHFQHLGVPFSGAMDMYAAKIANAILGNDEDSAVLEVTMLGPKLEFDCNTIISITGANLSPVVNGIEIKNYSAINIHKGDILSFGKPIKGFRSYIAVSGGFQTEVKLESRSMYKGVTKTQCIKKGDELEIIPRSRSIENYSSIKFNIEYLDSNIITVYKGPEFENLNKTQINTLFNQEFTVSKNNNRMAYQLYEPVLHELDELITSFVLPGTIQLTPSGKLIVLMKDCQTTGGYPRVLQLSESSINTLSQKMTGDKISFKLLNYQS